MGKKNMLRGHEMHKSASETASSAKKMQSGTSPCRHSHLHFEAGGLYIVCSNPECKYVWAAVGNCPMRIIQDVMARAQGLSELDKRSDPYATPL